jgi:acyl-CoA reductase-like NAD-dependent aldehyde dehydrogenase
VGDPAEEGRHIGPLVSQAQFDKVQGLIEAGVAEGARLVAGGPDGRKASTAAIMRAPPCSPTSTTR